MRCKLKKSDVELEAYEYAGKLDKRKMHAWMKDEMKAGNVKENGLGKVEFFNDGSMMLLSKGDVVVKLKDGSLMPCKRDTFDATFDIVDEGHQADNAEAVEEVESKDDEVIPFYGDDDAEADDFHDAEITD